jgi:signal transduction histidine kinase
MGRSSVIERIANWRPLRRGKGRYAKEAGASLFQGLRIRLTLWYCGVLGAALVLFGVILYFGAQFFLINPIEADAQQHADAHVSQLVLPLPTRGPGNPCSTFSGGFPPPDLGQSTTELVACFDMNGTLVQVDSTPYLPSAFLSNNLAKTVLQTGRATSDFVNVGGSLGQVYRYAEVVPLPSGHGYAGVVMVGETVQAQEDALATMLKLLLALGGAALLGAGIGGLFLANRALAPARLAWANQQRFIADAAHELRTPLTLLRADAEVLLRGRRRMDAEDAGLLEDIVAEANHMSTLATNLLTLARLDSGKLHREHEVVSLAELAQEGVRRVKALADQAGITVQAEDSDDPYVIGDPMLLEQAILVLLDNAIKYNRPGGSVVLRTTAKDDHAAIEVSDTGIGIPAEHLPHLGERFYRVDKARSREAGGTGLGLSIAHGIAAVHGGTLTLTSVAEQGTTVTISLPLAQVILSDLAGETPGSMSSQPEITLRESQ